MTRIVRPVGRVLKAAEAGLYRDASAAVAIAAATASRQRAELAAELVRERARIREDAAAEARAEATRMLADTALAAQRAAAGMTRDIAEAIAAGVATVINGRGLAEAVARAAERAVSELSERNAVTVRVAPNAFVATGARLEVTAPAVRVVADGTLPADGCIIETNAGFVRAGLSEQLANLETALLAAAEGVQADA